MSKKNGKWVVGVILLTVAALSFISVLIQDRIDKKAGIEKTVPEVAPE